MRRKVKRVLDEDTFETYHKVNGSNFIRIAGKDGRELHESGGKVARDRLKRQIQNKTVTLKPVGRSYGRTVAIVRHKRKLLR